MWSICMKKLICAVLALSLSLVVFGCSGEDDKKASSGATSSTPTIAVNPTATPAATQAPEAKKVSVVKITGDGVNIRADNSTDGEVYAVAEKDEYYALVKEGSEWHQITYDGKDAYVSAEFAKVEEVTEDVLKGNTPTETSEAETSDAETSSTSTGNPTTDDSSSSGINADDIRSEEDGQAGR